MSSYTPNITQLQESNSTTYADLVGIQIGLTRLAGETSNQYVKRLEYAVGLTRTHPYVGSLNEVNIQLGVEPAIYIGLNLSPNTIVTSTIAGITIANKPIIPLLTFDLDSMWDWRMLSDIVQDLNAATPGVATLLVSDGPALQIANQTNSLYSFGESLPISGLQIQLQHTGIQVGTELFSQTVSSYTLTPGGLLTFSVSPPNGTTITYNYIVTPYNLVGAPVAIIGLTSPGFSSIAQTPNGIMAYQAREFVQDIMNIDRSYWGQ